MRFKARLNASRHTYNFASIMSIPNPHELVPLELAARSIQERAYPERSLFAFPEEHLNGIAYTVAALVPLYALNGTGEVRAVTQDELQHGYFRRGAKQLQFLDNRQCLKALAVTASAVETVVRSILAAKTP